MTNVSKPIQYMFILGFLWSIGLIGGVVSSSSPSHALTIELGVSTAKASRAMVNQGFTQINILKKGFKTIEATACQNGTRFKLKIDSRYRIKKTQDLGACRRTVSIKSLTRNLERNGYQRILIEDQNGKYVAIACRDGSRVRITFSQQGEVLQRRGIGECRDVLEPNDIRQALRSQGFNRITLTDRSLPRYVAEACYENRRYELVLNRFGEIRSERRIGDCAPPLDPRNLTAFLENKGYERVEIINNQLPIYQVQACLREDLYELQLDRFGTITSRNVIARCRKTMSEQEIVQVLEAEGFTRVSVTKNGRGQFRIEACFEGYKKFATLSRTGELLNERDGERCQPVSISEITNTMRQRGFRNLEFYAEGCRNGRKIRILYNQDGERIRRERIGSC